MSQVHASDEVLWRPPADVLESEVAALLKPMGLSAVQYNVLRILRAAGKEGMPSGQIAARMLTHDPDVTRLLDRLESRGLIALRRRNESPETR